MPRQCSRHRVDGFNDPMLGRALEKIWNKRAIEELVGQFTSNLGNQAIEHP
ncbi:MAG: hypothetical protein VB144_10375 [Clostridia bacterium]|nr:hypothetical protein [Clostridia bacterium]